MDFLNELGTRYEGLFTMASSLFGIAGFIFGWWRYVKERKVRRNLEEKQAELDKTLSHLKHLEEFSSNLDQYSRVV